MSFDSPPTISLQSAKLRDLATIYVDLKKKLYDEYFYIRFVWHTDLKSIPHALAPTSLFSTKSEVDD